jgi:hypothetical protein
MAKRPVFVPIGSLEHLVDEVDIEFGWNPGFAPVQKKKNVVALHAAASLKGLSPLLEVSTKSSELLGQRLSAFSLEIESSLGNISIEAAYQGSKVFEHGGPYVDLYRKDSRSAKSDPRIKESGRLVGFDFFGQEWPLVPKTAFYDWLYLSALRPHQDYLTRLFNYGGFTDIEFNPERSINCQARTCALLVSLLRLKIFNRALESQRGFIDVMASDSLLKNHSCDLRQHGMFSDDSPDNIA